ncbi:MAG: hypothetical protein K0Q67_2595 [Cellvibrio sp.]|nr:hypothetical protein [Cellvibrio sp.]
MATINTPVTERRHLPERRVNGTSSTISAVDWVAMVLVIVGGINWGLVGLFQFDLVAAIFGAMSPMSRIVYTLVGLSALWMIYSATKMAKKRI